MLGRFFSLSDEALLLPDVPSQRISSLIELNNPYIKKDFLQSVEVLPLSKVLNYPLGDCKGSPFIKNFLGKPDLSGFRNFGRLLHADLCMNLKCFENAEFHSTLFEVRLTNAFSPRLEYQVLFAQLD